MRHTLSLIAASTLAAAAFATLTLPVAAHAQAQDTYREYTPAFDWKPHVSGDNELTNTYQYWKDATKLNPEWAASKDNQWKLNWKFMDASADDTLHGGAVALDKGEVLYRDLNKDGRFGACLGAGKGEPKVALKGLRANHYPQYRKDVKRVVGLEEAIELCAAKQKVTLENGSYNNSAISIYVASFSQGMPINIDVSKGPLKDAFERGKERYHLRVGANHFSCASCHVQMVGRSLRGQVPTSPYGDAGHWPSYRTRGELLSLHMRLTECNRNAGAQPLRLGALAYNDLEVFLTALSNGYPVDVPSARD